MVAWYRGICVLALFLATCRTAPSNGVNLLEVPKECKGKVGFCYVKPKGYDKLAQKMLAVLPTYLKKEYSQRDSADKPYKREIPRNETIHSCPYVERRDRAYQYIYDVDETKVDTFPQMPYFNQYVTTVQCHYGSNGITKEEIQSKLECFNKILREDFGLLSKCAQSYSERALYIYNGSDIVSKRFRIPSCCSCEIYNK